MYCVVESSIEWQPSRLPQGQGGTLVARVQVTKGTNGICNSNKIGGLVDSNIAWLSIGIPHSPCLLTRTEIEKTKHLGYRSCSRMMNAYMNTHYCKLR